MRWDETKLEQIDSTIDKWSPGMNMLITDTTWLLFFGLIPNHLWFKWEPTITEVFHDNYPRTNTKIIKGKKLSSFDLFKTRTERNIIHHDETVCYDIRKKIMNKIGKDWNGMDFNMKTKYGTWCNLTINYGMW